MKTLLTTLLVIVFITVGCDKKATDSDDNGANKTEHVSINIKTATEYFNFANNLGSTNQASAHDIIFYSVSWQPPGSPATIKDPRFKCKEGLSVAVINESDLDEVTSVPSTSNFVADFVSEFGEWYDEDDNTHIITPQDKVYVVNTSDGKFPAFKVVSYYDERGVSGVFTIDWKYLN